MISRALAIAAIACTASASACTCPTAPDTMVEEARTVERRYVRSLAGQANGQTTKSLTWNPDGTVMETHHSEIPGAEGLLLFEGAQHWDAQGRTTLWRLDIAAGENQQRHEYRIRGATLTLTIKRGEDEQTTEHDVPTGHRSERSVCTELIAKARRSGQSEKLAYLAFNPQTAEFGNATMTVRGAPPYQHGEQAVTAWHQTGELPGGNATALVDDDCLDLRVEMDGGGVVEWAPQPAATGG